VNRHRFDFSIRNVIGTAALAAAAVLTIMFVVASATHSNEAVHGAYGATAFRSTQGPR
jgi:hypothetical protein